MTAYHYPGLCSNQLELELIAFFSIQFEIESAFQIAFVIDLIPPIQTQ